MCYFQVVYSIHQSKADMGSLLEQIISGREGSSIVLVQDSVEHRGRHLIKSCLKEFAKRFEEVHLFAFDQVPDALLAGLDPDTRGKTVCHDGWTNPGGWNTDSDSAPKYNCVQFGSSKDLLDHVKEQRQRGSVRVCVVIDSLTPFILHRSAPFTCKSLHNLTHQPPASEFQVVQVLGLLHADVHDESVLRTIGHISSTVITVSPNASIAPIDRDPVGYCDIRHKRTSGKILQKREGYSVGDDYRLITFPGISTVKPTGRTEEDAQPDPTANLTFNLTLSESERKARENVVLPFTRTSNNIGQGSGQGSGQIFYQPDQADDYDDEDPDDDLDI